MSRFIRKAQRTFLFVTSKTLTNDIQSSSSSAAAASLLQFKPYATFGTNIINRIYEYHKEYAPPHKVVSYEKEKAQCKQNRATCDGLYENLELKSAVLERALYIQANLSSEFPSFIKHILPSHHVTGRFWLRIPAHFCLNHLPKEDRMMVLEDEEGEVFEVKYLPECFGVSAGWKGFSTAHKLLEGDICVFHLVKPFKFKVYIVRKKGSDVVLDVAPPRKIVSYENEKAQCKQKRATCDELYENPELKSAVLERALVIQANLSAEFPSFVKHMFPSNVTGVRGHWLAIPMHFRLNHLPKEDQMMVLEDEEGEVFEVKYLPESFGLIAGWRAFSTAHKLLEGDICVFHLVKPFKFKVYIVRKKGSDENVALGHLKLESCTQQVESGKTPKICENGVSVGKTEDRNDPILVSDHDSEVSDGVRPSEYTVDFKEMKSFEDFNIFVNGLIIDSELSNYHKIKYYELCCDQNSFLHKDLLEGLDCKLVSGVIAETINIVDAIRAAKLTTSHEYFLTWDKKLKSFEGLGMNVGFLRARLDQLMNLSTRSIRGKEVKLERANAYEEKQKLEAKLAEVTETLNRLDTEIRSFEQENAYELEALFRKVVNAPW